MHTTRPYGQTGGRFVGAHALEPDPDPFDEVTAAAHDFMALVAATGVWITGDGFGGWVYDQLVRAAKEVGLPTPPKLVVTPAERERRRLGAQARRRVMERDEYRCRRCGDHRSLEIDHIIAIKDDGTSDDDNLQTLCKPCHKQKTAGR